MQRQTDHYSDDDFVPVKRGKSPEAIAAKNARYKQRYKAISKMKKSHPELTRKECGAIITARFAAAKATTLP